MIKSPEFGLCYQISNKRIRKFNFKLNSFFMLKFLIKLIIYWNVQNIDYRNYLNLYDFFCCQ